MVTGFELQVRRQIGQKFTIRVVMVDLDSVGDDVLGHGSVEPDLVDHAIKDLVSKGVDREIYRLALMDLAYVSLVHRCPDLDAMEVLGD